jgi:hypothetical protein
MTGQLISEVFAQFSIHVQVILGALTGIADFCVLCAGIPSGSVLHLDIGLHLL